MDLSFSRRQKARHAAVGRRDGYATLVAGLSGAQATSPTAIAAARLNTSSPVATDALTALAALFAGRADWRSASLLLDGSFHPRLAMAAAGKARSTLVKAGFTFAF